MDMDIATFIRTANRLKDVKRAGWVERGVKDPESVADHSFMAALLCMIFPAKGIDRDKAIKMALIHDLAEAETGDIITTENWSEKGTISKKDKEVLERKALRKILVGLDPGVSKEIIDLWDEFHEGKTPEAVFAKDVDNAERILQAVEYRKNKNYKKPLDGFWDKKGLGMIKDENIKRIVLDIIGKGQ